MIYLKLYITIGIGEKSIDLHVISELWDMGSWIIKKITFSKYDALAQTVINILICF